MFKNAILTPVCFLFIFLNINIVKAEKSSDEFFVHLVSSNNWVGSSYVENGVEKKLPHEIASETLKRAGLKYEYQALPWARAYDYALKRKNYLIIGIGRTPKREKLFSWVGQATEGVDVFFYKLKSSEIKIKTVDDLKKYTVITERNSYYQDFLEINNFENIHLVTNPIQIVKMAEAKRYPLFLLKEVQFIKEAKKAEIDPELFEKIFLAFSISEYMAFSINTSSELVEKVKKAHQELLKEGRITFLVDR